VPARHFFRGRPGLRPVECLDLALFIDGRDDGMGRRRDVKPDDVVKLLGKGFIIRQFETAPAMGCKSMRMPDLHDRRGCNANSLGHRTNSPVRCFLLRRLKRQRDNPLNAFAIKRCNARRPALVMQKAIGASVTKRSCQRQTQVLDLPVASMIATVPEPSLLIKMILSRHTCF
jgi:hypothetical protein